MAYEPIKPETQELYLKIWTHFCIAHFNKRQLAELFQCSDDTVGNAIKWSAANRTKFESFILAEAAKEALEVRLRDLNNDIARIKESNPVNWNAVIGLHKIIQESERMLWKFQCLIRDVHIIDVTPYRPELEWAYSLTETLHHSDVTQEERNTISDILRKRLGRKPRPKSEQVL